MVGAAAFDPGTKPAKRRSWSRGVRLAVNLPKSIRSQELTVQLVPRLPSDARSAMRQLIRPDVLFVIGTGVQQRPCFQHDYIQAAFGQHLGGGTAPRTRADDADVVYLG